MGVKSRPAAAAVVPVEPDALRAPAERGDAEPESTARPVEEPRETRERAELPAERAALDRARVAPEAPVPRLAGGEDRFGGEHPVLEREGDALAHERIRARSVARDERVRRRDRRPGRPGPDGERLPPVPAPR